MKNVTIREVARKVGVSPTTVSRVINKRTEGYMREATKKQVLTAIRELEASRDYGRE